MKHYHQDPIRVWEYWYGNRIIVRDISGRLISKTQFNTTHEHSWNIDHILPMSMGGTDILENIIPVHKKTNEEKAASFPTFWANNNNVQIKSISLRKGNKYVKSWEIYCNGQKVI